MGLSGWRELWEEWALRSTVLLSVLFQILLTLIMLSRRRRFRNLFLKFLLWLCYSLADMVVIYALGMISCKLEVISKQLAGGTNKQSVEGTTNPQGSLTEQDKLIAFWTPILMLMLGGPDSITAYSLEDNELWKRQFLAQIGQAVGTIFIISMAWGDASYLTYLSISVLIVAIVKCGEKTVVQWMASMEKLQRSMSPPNPGPNYPKFIAEYCLREEEGYHLGIHEISDVHEPVDPSTESKYKDIVRAQAVFPSFRRLFADLVLSDHDRTESKRIFESIRSANDAFRVVEIELHFMYEQLHTKARLLYSPRGVIFRVGFASAILAVTGVFTIFAVRDWKKYHLADLIVTFMVLTSLCVQEVTALITIVISYTANDWRHPGEKSLITCRFPCLDLGRSKQPITTCRFRCLDLGRSKQPRFSNHMGQFCLLDFVVKSRTSKARHLFLEAINLESSWYTDYVDISPGLKGIILSSIKRLLEQGDDGSANIGEWNQQIAVGIMRKHNILDSDHMLSWSTELEFDHCVLVWHIATELWFQKAEDNNLSDDNMVWSRLLSRYMVYLLVNCPTMLPNGISNIRIQDTEAEASDFFRGMKSSAFANEEFYKVRTAVEPVKVKGSISKSVLFDGRRLESGLIVIESDPTLRERKWRMITDVWFHLLIYAAKRCTGSTHAKHLRRGGELLTQVWMLMAHFGLTDHFQLRQGSVISMLRKS